MSGSQGLLRRRSLAKAGRASEGLYRILLALFGGLDCSWHRCLMVAEWVAGWET